MEVKVGPERQEVSTVPTVRRTLAGFRPSWLLNRSRNLLDVFNFGTVGGITVNIALVRTATHVLLPKWPIIVVVARLPFPSLS